MSLRSAATSRGPARYGMLEQARQKAPVITVTANRTLTPSDSGVTFLIGAPDLVISLPATVAGLLFKFRIITAGLSAGTGLSISPVALDNIYGNGLTALDDKDIILAGSGDRIGDLIELEGDGTTGYAINYLLGTWTKQA